jgi:transcriptional regulator with GAF, ATPase, and Fis domain
MASSEQRLIETLVFLADTLVKDFEILDLFYHLVDSAPDLVNADGAGLLLANENQELEIMAVTSETVGLIELFQVQQKEGPCYDAFEFGEPIFGSIKDEKADEKWPSFARSARAVGFGSVAAVPLRLRDQVLGALNLFAVQEELIADRDLRAAQALADIATIAILQHKAAQDSTLLVDQLQTALDSRVVIEQAKGIVAQALGVDMDEAFSRLRRYTRDRNEVLRGTAQAIVSGELDPNLLPIA